MREDISYFFSVIPGRILSDAVFGEIFMYIYPNMNMRIGCFVRSSLIHSRISRDTAAKIVIIRHIVSVIYQACTRGVVTAKEGVCLRYSGLFFFSGEYNYLWYKYVLSV